ncbi:hypothetical protein GCM10009786_12790 [Leucobacter alluvii]|uniref:Uncharacterized protein n=1 Tax=Leucobacter alluvii TaxID=340321 RepID=A0ABP5MYV0_9MICO
MNETLQSSDAPSEAPTEALTERRRGRKRLIIAGGALIGVGALATVAAFTDFGLLNLGGDGGFGGPDNVYNIQVSAGQEDTVGDVASWIEANPDAVDVVPIAGADSLIPGGAPVDVSIPVLNASPTFGSTLEVSIEDTTPVDSDGAQETRNNAYAALARVSIAQVADASTTPTSWVIEDATISAANTALDTLAAEAGVVTVVRVELVEGATQEETNAANGGMVNLQARFDGTSVN